jgi:predicted nuclease of restriction endonuclease-like RecB superfamily
VTKYGLQLALCWPVIALQAELSLVADVRWGKKNEPLKFRYTTKEKKAGKGTLGGNRTETVTSLAISDAESGPTTSDDGDDETQFKQALARALPEVSVTVAERMLELPGTGLIVPDLCCTFDDGTEVFVELLGFWSREAVFRRVELVEAGLVAPILFLVSSRLRVSEEVLDDASNAALYVYRGRINAATAASKINELYRRLRPPIPTKAKRRSK